MVYVGLIGGGNISETHARAARAIPGVALAAIYGTNTEKVERLSREHDCKAYRNLDAFLDHRPMDLVAIGSASGLHAAHGVAAARHGLHVLTEKPIEISTSRADELIEATTKAGVKLGVFFQDRCKPDIRHLKEWIAQGFLGRVLLVDARVKWYRPAEYYSQSKWRGTFALDGGGVLINQAVHTLDLMLWLTGDVTEVQARIATVLHAIEAEDTGVVNFQFASGALGSLQATTAAFPGYPRRLEITGTEGTVILEQDRIVAVNLRNAPEGVTADAPSHDIENTSSPRVTDFTGHQAILEDFIRAIQQDGIPVCDGREGRRSVALVERIYRAARENCGG
jgi:UDP-N-acetyl-2-amino-2-deoxyglucuronate dehydrogenase